MTVIRTAVFPVAGYGTRFLPATKAMPKELLPILQKPLIQYAVEEAIEAGVDTLIFITGRNKRAIEDHFDRNLDLERALKHKGNNNKAKDIAEIIPRGVTSIFVRQQEPLGLGHAILCAEKVVGDNPFVVILADDFISGHNNTRSLIERFKNSLNSQLSYINVNDYKISNYGVIKRGKKANSVLGAVEKPLYEKAPSKRAIVGRYILTSDIFEHLKNSKRSVDNEIQLTDAIDRLATSSKVESLKLVGRRFDCGSLEGYLKAIIYQAKIYKLM